MASSVMQPVKTKRGLKRVYSWFHGSNTPELENDPNRFGELYSELTRQRFSRNDRDAIETPDEALVANRVSELCSNGIAICRGLFAETAWLNDAANEMTQLVEQWHQVFDSAPADMRRYDVNSGLSLTRGNFQRDGRIRGTYTDAKTMPAAYRQVMQHPALQEIASRYFDADTSASYLLAEQLQPSQAGDWWHIDRIVDQVKVMVLLTDCTLAHGPLRFKQQTHRHVTELQPVYFSIFRGGVDYAYPPGPLVDKIDGDIVFGTGKAGDAIIFDTLGIHSGMPCVEGVRQALVSTYFGNTDKTHQLQQLAGGRWI